MKVLLVARKSLVEIARELQLLGLVLLLPIVFLGISAATYTGSLWITHPVWVLAAEGREADLVGEMETQSYADGRPVFEITLAADRASADAALRDQEATALLIVGSDPSALPWPATKSTYLTYSRRRTAFLLCNRS